MVWRVTMRLARRHVRSWRSRRPRRAASLLVGIQQMTAHAPPWRAKLTAHRPTLTKKFVASTDGRLSLFFLPGYSPELNPDEWVWKNVKNDRVGRAGITTAADLKTKATGALRRLQRLPHLVRAFFTDLNLRYITT